MACIHSCHIRLQHSEGAMDIMHTQPANKAMAAELLSVCLFDRVAGAALLPIKSVIKNKSQGSGSGSVARGRALAGKLARMIKKEGTVRQRAEFPRREARAGCPKVSLLLL